jgi:thiol-disulfide isomerase/thioredoxin
MRSARVPILALSLLLAILVVTAGIIVMEGQRTPAEDSAIAPVAVPFGRFVAAANPPPAPSVGFADIAGNPARLADFRGKVVVANLWATWCAPCRREMPSLVRLQQRFGDKIAVVAISEDTGGTKAVTPFVAKYGLTAIKTYLDPKSAVGRAFKVDGLPTSIVIDRRGLVRGRVEGEADWVSPKMLAVIAPMIGEDDIVKTSSP